MSQMGNGSTALRELQRFLKVAESYQDETGKQAFMPACPVDTQWHQLLNSKPSEYGDFCQNAVGRDIRHMPAKGKGNIQWTRTYERLYGPLPEIWFSDIDGSLDVASQKKYINTGVFYASWDCVPL